MRISPSTTPQASRSDAAPEGPGLENRFDSALVLVHGMGNAYKSEILLEWAEPILQRIDWLARDPIIGGCDRHGVTIHDSDLAGDVPMITATIRYPGERARSAEAAASGPDDDVVRRIAILEARWSESFVPMTRAQIFRWAVFFMWRVIRRIIVLFLGTTVLVPKYTWVRHQSPGTRGKWYKRVFDFFVDSARLVVGVVAFVAIATFLVVLGIVLTPILPLISPLLLFPWFKNIAQGVIDGIIESIGDVAAWKERPVRASAMRLVVRAALERAKWLTRDPDGDGDPGGDVHLFAHSQGAAVATYALLEELAPRDYRVRRLTTVGAAVVLLGREKWRGRPDVYTPVADWITVNDGVPAGERLEWVNHWAIWDPFSAGPIADSAPRAHERWRDAYSPTRNTAPGPEEHAVHNTSQPFLDHSMYYQNTVQVVEPTARHLLGAEFPRQLETVAYVENRISVIDKMSLGLNMLAAVAIAALLPGLPGVYWLFTVVVDAVATAIGWLIGIATILLPGGRGIEESIASAKESAAFFINPQGLTAWSWVLASVLLLALLIWLNQLLWRASARGREWTRSPIRPRTWLVLTSVPRFAYVFGAFLCAGFAIATWPRPPLNPLELAVTVVVLAIAACIVFAEPLVAPVPVVVAARSARNAENLPTIVDSSRPLRLGEAVKDKQFIKEWDDRRALVDPQTWPSRLWAWCFLRWRPPVKTP